jgi:hypothetical protein
VRKNIFYHKVQWEISTKQKSKQKVAAKHPALTQSFNKKTNNFFVEICRILVAMHQNQHYKEIT